VIECAKVSDVARYLIPPIPAWTVSALTAQLNSAQAERDFARDDLTRYRELLNAVISPAEFDRHDMRTPPRGNGW